MCGMEGASALVVSCLYECTSVRACVHLCVLGHVTRNTEMDPVDRRFLGLVPVDAGIKREMMMAVGPIGSSGDGAVC